MPNIFDATGIQTATQAELVAQYTTALQTIYGASANLNPETPDGNWMMIIIQSVLDLEDLLVQINNSFDPDLAIGVLLDQRVAINGIQRQAGTFTVIPIDVVTDRSVNLPGLDQTLLPVYTISDAAGNQYQLQTTQNGTGTGSFSFSFQAAVPGAQTPTPNTITIPVSIVLGVTSVNNPGVATTVGLNEETDPQLRLRRQKSVSLPSQGYLAGLLAALENIPGVSFATVQENNGGTTIGSGPLAGLAGHSIWVIVAGSGSASAIAQAIYTKRNAGAGMRGSQSFVITQVDGSFFTVYWDDVEEIPLYTQIVVASIDGVTPPNIPAILNGSTGLPFTFDPGVFDEVNANEVSTLVQKIDPNTLATPVTFSAALAGTYFAILAPSAANQQFQVTGSNTIVIPMYISGTDVQLSVDTGGSVIAVLALSTGGSQALVANGGYQVGVSTPWNIDSQGSSGSMLDTNTGAYIAGSPGTDVISYTDNFGTPNVCTITVTVT